MGAPVEGEGCLYSGFEEGLGVGLVVYTLSGVRTGFCGFSELVPVDEGEGFIVGEISTSPGMIVGC